MSARRKPALRVLTPASPPPPWTEVLSARAEALPSELAFFTDRFAAAEAAAAEAVLAPLARLDPNARARVLNYVTTLLAWQPKADAPRAPLRALPGGAR